MDTIKSRVETIFINEMNGDTSFQEKANIFSLLFRRKKYSNQDMRETWHKGIKYGIEIGLHKASLDGQIIELNQNTSNDKHKEFIEKFYQLSNEYNCAIIHHPQYGLAVMSVKCI